MRRGKNLYDRGGPFVRWLRGVMAAVSDGRTWRRHPAPFSKSRRAKLRRRERAFVLRMKQEFLA